MVDFGKYDKNGKGFDFEQFRSKLDSEEVKKNKELQKFFGVFDTENHNGIIDTDSECNSLFAKANQYDKNKDGTLDDSEISEMLNSEPDMQAIKDDKNIFDAVKSFFSGLNKSEEQDLKKTVIDGVEIYRKDGKIVKKKNGNKTIEYTYNKTDDGKEYVTLQTPTSIIEVSKVDEEDGTFLEDDFIREATINLNGQYVIVEKNKEGNIIETVIQNETEWTTAIYNTNYVHLYNLFRDYLSKTYQEYTKDGKQFFVNYDENGNTITHAKNGDSVSRLTDKFDFQNVEEFYALNPSAKNKGLLVGQNIVVPNMLDANDERIISQGDVNEELNKYSIDQFRTKHLANISKETFNALNKIQGFELNNDNVGMYFKFNALDGGIQKLVLDDIMTLSKQGKTPDEIKEYFLQDTNAPQEKVAEGVTRRINLFDGFTINLRAFDGESLKGDLSVKGFVEQELGLDISKGEGKKLYDALCNVSDGYIAKDIEEMFSNIKYRTTVDYYKLYALQDEEIKSGKKHDNKLYRADLLMHKENPPLTPDEAKEMYKAVIKKLTSPEGTVVSTKYDNFINNHKDSYLRDFTADMIAMLHGQGAEIFKQTGASKDMLQLGYVLNPIANYYATKGKDIYERMNYDGCIGDNILTTSLEVYTMSQNINGIQKGVKYDKAKIKKCYDVFHNPKSTEAQKKKAMEEAFGYGVVNTATELAGTSNFIDGATDMALLLYGTGAISKVLTKGIALASRGAKVTTTAARAIKGGKNAATFGERLLQVGTSATTFAIWDSFRYTLGYYTNDIDETQLGENSYTYG
ncbi:MAG: hypothetical protein MJ231_04675, partial [bacterium]|nr:hypothetical protein [bacterium]